MFTPTLVAEHRWQSHPANVQQARRVAREVFHRYAAAEADLVELAIGEACANAVTHGSPRGEADAFTLRCFVECEFVECEFVECEFVEYGRGTALVFEVEDEGRDLSARDVPLLALPDTYSEHGRGLFMIGQIMDEVALCSTPRGLNVRMAKRVPLVYCPVPLGSLF